MSRKKETKTNAMRILDAAHVDHVVHTVDATGEDTGVDIALRAGRIPTTSSRRSSRRAKAVSISSS